MKVYIFYWKRKKGKVTKDGRTHVIAESMNEAFRLFESTYPDRTLDSIHEEGDDVIGIN